MGHLTQAQSNMLEVLPPNASKGNGVKRLLKSLNILPEHVMAIGDAENVSLSITSAACSLMVVVESRHTRID